MLSESGFAGFGDFQDCWRPVERWNCRGRGSGVGGRGSGVGGRGSGVGGRGSGVGGRGSGVGGRGSGVGGRGSGVGGRGSGVGGRGSGVGGRGSGVGGRGEGGGDRGEGPETRAAAAGLVLKGGVAGGVPPHKGGPKARPPKTKREGRGVRSEKNLCWHHKGTRKAVTVRDAFGYRVGLICVGTNWLWV